mgnify:CR=1 FL=1
MIGQSVGSDASPLSCFLFRLRKSREKCRKRSHINASNASVIRTSRIFQAPLQTPLPRFHQWVKLVLAQSSAKRPTFAFTGESGYTLGFRRKIAHNGSHAETGAVSDGGAITTLGAFHTFRKPCVARCQNGKLCRFWVLVGGTPEGHREPAEQRCAYARHCSAGVAAPLGCAASFAIWRCCFFSLCVRYFLHVRGKGGYHHSRRALHVVETPDARLSKRLTRRFLALPDSSLIPAAQNIVPFLYRCQKDQRDTRWSFHFCSHLLTCPDRPDRGT